MAEVDPKDARIAELERQVEELTRLVQELREQLRRNSGNSNRPPSSDTPGQKAERRRRSGSEKKRGGQLGHKGQTRALVSEEKVSEFKLLFPSACGNCWAPLSSEGGTRVRRYQSVELPPLKAHVTQWMSHGVECPRCKHETWASTAAIPTSPFGPRLSAVVGLLTGVYHLSRRSAVRLLGDVLGIDISLGAVSAVEARVSEAVKPAVDEAWSRVLLAPVKHTPVRTSSSTGRRCGLSLTGRESSPPTTMPSAS